MALSKSTITGRVPLPTDENLQFAELTFALSGLDTEGASVLPGGVSTRAVLVGSDIPAGFELWQNTAGLRGTHYRVLARWTVKDRDGIRDQYADLGVIQIGSDPSYTLADLINNGVPPAIGTFWSAITQAQYDAVIQAAADAQASATAAALYDGPWLDTVAALIADTSLTYAPALPGTVVAGDYVQTRKEGFSYQVAASGASDQHVTMAGGLKLYVKPNSASEVSPLQFGSPVDGTNDDSAALAACFAAAIANDWTVDLGDHSYTHGTAALTRTSLLVTLGADQNFRVTGNGATIRDRDGLTNALGNFNRTISVNVPTGVTAGHVQIEGLCIDKRGSTVTVTSGAFTYEQAHAIAIYSTGTGKYKSITLRDVFTKDKVGGGIVLAGGYSDVLTVENCHGVDFLYTGGRRGDLEVQMTVAHGSVTDCTGDFSQLEPNVSVPNGGIANPVLTYTNCNYTVFDLIGFSAALTAQKFHLVNCTNGPSGDFWVRSAQFSFTNCDMRANGTTDWRNAIGTYSGGSIIIGIDLGGNAFNPLNISATTAVKVDALFHGVRFVPDASVNAATTGFVLTNSAVVLAADVPKFKLRCEECTFDPAFQKVANAYRNGQWEFARCKLVSRSGAAAFGAGAGGAYQGNLMIDDCDLSGIAGSLINVGASSAAWVLALRGALDYAKYGITGTAATSWQAYVVNDATWVADARPAAAGYAGQRVKLRLPGLGAADEWLCTTGSNTTATWQMIRQAGLAKGLTAARPSPNALDIGLAYLDTTLDADGKPIWWNGSAWVDATGATV